MKTSVKALPLYLYSVLLMLAVSILVYSIFSRTQWVAFFNAAGIFLPLVFEMAVVIILFALSIYLMRKGVNYGKAKKHVRFL